MQYSVPRMRLSDAYYYVRTEQTERIFRQKACDFTESGTFFVGYSFQRAIVAFRILFQFPRSILTTVNKSENCFCLFVC